MFSFKLFITISPCSVGGIEFKINETSFNNITLSFNYLFLPNVEALEQWETLIHEWIGYLFD